MKGLDYFDVMVSKDTTNRLALRRERTAEKTLSEIVECLTSRVNRMCESIATG